MISEASTLAARLAEHAEEVCRHYLSEGRRRGRYWQVGDVSNTPGRSLYVRLFGPSFGPGAAGKWVDAATGEHGDLLDLIRLTCGHFRLRDTLAEARDFLQDPNRVAAPARGAAPRNSVESARRLFAASRPIGGTLAEIYLRKRGITLPLRFPSLRCHPDCYYRADKDSPLETWPALIASVTDLSGNITGIHRTWLARDGRGKAPLADPRRSMGQLLGHAVQFGAATDVLAAAEGIETALALKCLLPSLPVAAALSASNLSALLFPHGLRRLYIAADNDAAGVRALERLKERAEGAEVEAHPLLPCFEDWNEDLVEAGSHEAFRTAAGQMLVQDVERFACLPLSG
jgi:Toprim domain-containing protein